MCMGVADLITDGIVYARLASGDVAVANEVYKAAYVAILCFGAATIGLSLAYRVRNGLLVRASLFELDLRGRTASASTSEARRLVQQHEFELAQTHRTQVILALSLLSVVAQGALPLRFPLFNRAFMPPRAT